MSAHEILDELADWTGLDLGSGDLDDRLRLLSDHIKRWGEALLMYASPESYLAVVIFPDRPAGEFADDVGCCLGPHGDHDHRHGRTARRALGSEWWGTEPCEAMLERIQKEQT